MGTRLSCTSDTSPSSAATSTSVSSLGFTAPLSAGGALSCRLGVLADLRPNSEGWRSADLGGQKHHAWAASPY